MRKNCITINVNISPSIFNESILNKRIISLFDSMEEPINLKFNEILNFIDEEYTKNCYNILFPLFKIYFFEQILNMSALVIFHPPIYNYSISEIILTFLTEENLINAINGDPMFYTFNEYITYLYPSPLRNCGKKILLNIYFKKNN